MSDAPFQFTAPSPDELAHLFPGYKVLRLIACGGMGAVYEAVQHSLERAVAIKILPQELTQDASFRDHFVSEARAMARLNHPNLIGVHDFGEVDGMLFIVMEYVPGTSLHQIAQQHRMDPQDVARLLAGVARGLAHAHENGIIHRDIKPSNILLDANYQPKIGDFGLAGSAAQGEEPYGTPGYTAPEVTVNPAAVDHRVDIFSLGVLTHELLTGQLPDESHTPPSSYCSCDRRFDALVRKATQWMPAARYHSAMEMAAEFDALAESAASPAARVIVPATGSTGRLPVRTAARVPARSSARVPVKPVPKKSSGSGLVFLAVGLGALVVGAVIFSQMGGSTETPQLAVEPPLVIPPTATPPPPADAVPTDPLLDPFRPDPSISGVAGAEPVVGEMPDGSQLVHWGGATSDWQDSGGRLHIFTITGLDIWGTEDDGIFRSIRWQGDGVFTLTLDELKDAHPQAKAGLMIRSSLHRDAANVFLAMTVDNGTMLSTRSGAEEATQLADIRVEPLAYLRLSNQGGQITARVSSDGNEWIVLGNPLRLEGLDDGFHVGFAASSQGSSDPRPLTGRIRALVTVEPSSVATQPSPGDAPIPQPPPAMDPAVARAQVEQFIERAKSVMVERGAPDIARFTDARLANLRRFEREIRLLANRFGTNQERQTANDMITGLLRSISQNNNRMPPELDEDFEFINGSRQVLASALLDQQRVDASFVDALERQGATYVAGLERELQRLQQEGAASAADLIRREVERVKTDPGYFPGLMTDVFPPDEKKAEEEAAEAGRFRPSFPQFNRDQSFQR